MAAALESEKTVCAFSFNRKNNFLVAIKRSLVGRHNPYTPTFGFAIARVHPEKIPGKKRSLFASGPSSDFKAGIAPFEWVRRQKPREYIAFGVGDCGGKALDFALSLREKFRIHAGIREHGLSAFNVVEQLEVALCRRFEFLEGGMLAYGIAVALCVCNNRRIAHSGFHRNQAIQYSSNLGFFYQAFFWNLA
jgi:hypothetical protein